MRHLSPPVGSPRQPSLRPASRRLPGGRSRPTRPPIWTSLSPAVRAATLTQLSHMVCALLHPDGPPTSQGGIRHERIDQDHP